MLLSDILRNGIKIGNWYSIEVDLLGERRRIDGLITDIDEKRNKITIMYSEGQEQDFSSQQIMSVSKIEDYRRNSQEIEMEIDGVISKLNTYYRNNVPMPQITLGDALNNIKQAGGEPDDVAGLFLLRNDSFPFVVLAQIPKLLWENETNSRFAFEILLFAVQYCIDHPTDLSDAYMPFFPDQRALYSSKNVQILRRIGRQLKRQYETLMKNELPVQRERGYIQSFSISSGKIRIDSKAIFYFNLNGVRDSRLIAFLNRYDARGIEVEFSLGDNGGPNPMATAIMLTPNAIETISLLFPEFDIEIETTIPENYNQAMPWQKNMIGSITLWEERAKCIKYPCMLQGRITKINESDGIITSDEGEQFSFSLYQIEDSTLFKMSMLNARVVFIPAYNHTSNDLSTKWADHIVLDSNYVGENIGFEESKMIVKDLVAPFYRPLQPWLSDYDELLNESKKGKILEYDITKNYGKIYSKTGSVFFYIDRVREDYLYRVLSNPSLYQLFVVKRNYIDVTFNLANDGIHPYLVADNICLTALGRKTLAGFIGLTPPIKNGSLQFISREYFIPLSGNTKLIKPESGNEFRLSKTLCYRRTKYNVGEKCEGEIAAIVPASAKLANMIKVDSSLANKVRGIISKGEKDYIPFDYSRTDGVLKDVISSYRCIGEKVSFVVDRDEDGKEVATCVQLQADSNIGHIGSSEKKEKRKKYKGYIESIINDEKTLLPSGIINGYDDDKRFSIGFSYNNIQENNILVMLKKARKNLIFKEVEFYLGNDNGTMVADFICLTDSERKRLYSHNLIQDNIGFEREDGFVPLSEWDEDPYWKRVAVENETSAAPQEKAESEVKHIEHKKKQYSGRIYLVQRDPETHDILKGWISVSHPDPQQRGVVSFTVDGIKQKCLYYLLNSTIDQVCSYQVNFLIGKDMEGDTIVSRAFHITLQETARMRLVADGLINDDGGADRSNVLADYDDWEKEYDWRFHSQIERTTIFGEITYASKTEEKGSVVTAETKEPFFFFFSNVKDGLLISALRAGINCKGVRVEFKISVNSKGYIADEIILSESERSNLILRNSVLRDNDTLVNTGFRPALPCPDGVYVWKTNKANLEETIIEWTRHKGRTGDVKTTFGFIIPDETTWGSSTFYHFNNIASVSLRRCFGEAKKSIENENRFRGCEVTYVLADNGRDKPIADCVRPTDEGLAFLREKFPMIMIPDKDYDAPAYRSTGSHWDEDRIPETVDLLSPSDIAEEERAIETILVPQNTEDKKESITQSDTDLGAEAENNSNLATEKEEAILLTKESDISEQASNSYKLERDYFHEQLFDIIKDNNQMSTINIHKITKLFIRDMKDIDSFKVRLSNRNREAMGLDIHDTQDAVDRLQSMDDTECASAVEFLCRQYTDGRIKNTHDRGLVLLNYVMLYCPEIFSSEQLIDWLLKSYQYCFEFYGETEFKYLRAVSLISYRYNGQIEILKTLNRAMQQTNISAEEISKTVRHLNRVINLMAGGPSFDELVLQIGLVTTPQPILVDGQNRKAYNRQLVSLLKEVPSLSEMQTSRIARLFMRQGNGNTIYDSKLQNRHKPYSVELGFDEQIWIDQLSSVDDATVVKAVNNLCNQIYGVKSNRQRDKALALIDAVLRNCPNIFNAQSMVSLLFTVYQYDMPGKPEEDYIRIRTTALMIIRYSEKREHAEEILRVAGERMEVSAEEKARTDSILQTVKQIVKEDAEHPRAVSESMNSAIPDSMEDAQKADIEESNTQDDNMPEVFREPFVANRLKLLNDKDLSLVGRIAQDPQGFIEGIARGDYNNWLDAAERSFWLAKVYLQIKDYSSASLNLFEALVHLGDMYRKKGRGGDFALRYAASYIYQIAYPLCESNKLRKALTMGIMCCCRTDVYKRRGTESEWSRLIAEDLLKDRDTEVMAELLPTKNRVLRSVREMLFVVLRQEYNPTMSTAIISACDVDGSLSDEEVRDTFLEVIGEQEILDTSLSELYKKAHEAYKSSSNSFVRTVQNSFPILESYDVDEITSIDVRRGIQAIKEHPFLSFLYSPEVKQIEEYLLLLDKWNTTLSSGNTQGIYQGLFETKKELARLFINIKNTPSMIGYEAIWQTIVRIDGVIDQLINNIKEKHMPNLEIRHINTWIEPEKPSCINFFVGIKNPRTCLNLQDIKVESEDPGKTIEIVRDSNNEINIQGGFDETKLQMIVNLDNKIISDDTTTIEIGMLISGNVGLRDNKDDQLRIEVRKSLSLPILSWSEKMKMPNRFSGIAKNNGVPLNLAFGRERLVTELMNSHIYNAVNGKIGEGILIIYGQRRIGKTTLAKMIQQKIIEYASEKHEPIVVIDSVNIQTGLVSADGYSPQTFFDSGLIMHLKYAVEDYYPEIAEVIEDRFDKIWNDAGEKVQRLENAWISAIAQSGMNSRIILDAKKQTQNEAWMIFRNAFINCVRAVRDGFIRSDKYNESPRIVVFFDEFTSLYPGLKNGSIPRHVLEFFDELQCEHHMNVVMVALDQYTAMTEDLDSGTKNTFARFKDVRIGNFDPDEARSMIRQLMTDDSGKQRIDENVIEIICEQTDCNAFLITNLGNWLVEFMNEKHHSVCTSEVFELFWKDRIIGVKPSVTTDLFESQYVDGRFAYDDIKTNILTYLNVQILTQIARLGDKTRGYANRESLDISMYCRNGRTDGLINYVISHTNGFDEERIQQTLEIYIEECEADGKTLENHLISQLEQRNVVEYSNDRKDVRIVIPLFKEVLITLQNEFLGH